jgi:hypothetical protein
MAKLFLSWSGRQSKEIASLLKQYLESLPLSVDIFFSDADIVSGARARQVIDSALETFNLGLVVITADNLESPWIHFEAGALTKVPEVSAVIPLLFDVDISALKQPLAAFQGRKFNEAGILQLVRDLHALDPIRASAEVAVGAARGQFEQFKVSVDAVLQLPPENPGSPVAAPVALDEIRSTLDEVVTIVRELARTETGPVHQPPAGSVVPLNIMINDLRYLRQSRTEARALGIGSPCILMSLKGGWQVIRECRSHDNEFRRALANIRTFFYVLVNDEPAPGASLLDVPNNPPAPREEGSVDATVIVAPVVLGG